jgi:hypothetical protein
VTAEEAEQTTGFWSTFWGMTVRPWRTPGELVRDPVVLRKGELLLLPITLIYILILAIIIARGYPAAPLALTLMVEGQHPIQVLPGAAVLCDYRSHFRSWEVPPG